MAYVTPGTVVAGDVVTASALNVIANDIIDLDARVKRAVPAASLVTAQTTISSTSFVDTGLSVSITPSATSSLVEVSFTLNVGATSSLVASINLVRGATNIAQGTNATMGGLILNNNIVPFSMVFIDSPATTSATTYKIQLKVNGGTVILNRRGDTDDVKPLSILTVREVPQ
jgi:hypothetical protein